MFGSYDSIEEDYIFDKRNDYTDAYIRMMPSYKVSFFFIEKKINSNIHPVCYTVFLLGKYV